MEKETKWGNSNPLKDIEEGIKILDKYEPNWKDIMYRKYLFNF